MMENSFHLQVALAFSHLNSEGEIIQAQMSPVVCQTAVWLSFFVLFLSEVSISPFKHQIICEPVRCRK